MRQELSKAFLEKLQSVTAKRPRTVIDHILTHGQITTDELKATYGYNHPPRAARDVREHGIGLKTIRVEGPDGRRIGAYVFDESGGTGYSKRAGRTVVSNKLKAQLIQRHGARCFIYLETVPERALQVDHRVPYEIAGDAADPNQNPNDFMLLCASANRAKSWSCEYCPNWLQTKNTEVCRSCYWAFPESYNHVATRAERRVDIVWGACEVTDYEAARALAITAGTNLPEFVKQALRAALKS